MKKLMIVVLLCLGLLACGTQEEPQKNRKEEYPFVMVDFLRAKELDVDGDQKFFVYRCKYCLGVKSDLHYQQEFLSKTQKEILTLKVQRGKKSQEEVKKKRLEELERDEINTIRIISKMQKARQEFIENEK